MKNVVIVGASGMVGNILLKYCLDSNEIEKVTSIGRRKLGIDHPKLKQIVHKDFLNLSGIHPEFQNQDIAYFCIGVYTGAVTDEKFKEITVDYVKSIADVLKQNSPDVNFCLLSGAGADQTEKSKTSFARYKGMAENYLMSQNFGNLHLFRPGYIYPVEKRKSPNLMYSVSRLLYPIVKLMGNKYSIKSTELAEAMFKAGINPSSKTVLENNEILEILET